MATSITYVFTVRSKIENLILQNSTQFLYRTHLIIKFFMHKFRLLYIDAQNINALHICA